MTQLANIGAMQCRLREFEKYAPELFLLFQYEPKFFFRGIFDLMMHPILFQFFSLLKIHHNYENIFPPAVR